MTLLGVLLFACACQHGDVAELSKSGPLTPGEVQSVPAPSSAVPSPPQAEQTGPAPEEQTAAYYLSGGYQVFPPPRPASWSDFEEAAKFYAQGHFEEAHQLLGRIYQAKLTSRQNQQVRFLLGIAAYQTGRWDEVEKHLAGAGRVPAALQEYTYYFRGQAALADGRYDQAQSWLSQYLAARPDSPLAAEALTSKIMAEYYQGRREEALAECQSRFKNDDSGRFRLLAARILEGLGRRNEARAQYRTAMENSNRRPVRAEAAQKYEELLTPFLLEKGNDQEKLEMVRLLKKEWRLEEGLDLIERLLAEQPPLSIRGDLVSDKARLLFYSGRIKEALGYYQPYAKPDAAKRNPSGARMYARCLARLGRWEEAAAAYLLTAEVTHSSGNADEFRLEAGLLYLKAGDKDKAEAAWKKIRPAAAAGRFKDDLIWQRAWHYYRQKDWKQAATQFQALMQQCPKSKMLRDARYWLGRSLEKDGRTKEAQRHYRALAASNSEFYYRMLAEQSLKQVGSATLFPDHLTFRRLLTASCPGQDYSFLPLRFHQADSVGRPEWALSDPGLGLGDLRTESKKAARLSSIPLAAADLNQAILRLAELAAAGAVDLAHQEAFYIHERLGDKQPPVSPQARKASKKAQGELNARLSALKIRSFAFCSAYLAETGDYAAFVRLQYKNFRLLISGRSEEDKDKARRRFYPLAYPDAVLKAAQDSNLHPALILSVMRTESYYQADILSAANAKGLMQLLPTTGAKVADLAGVAAPAHEALFDPNLNIRLGSWYLAALYQEFDGQLPLALASYNAGPFNVKRWVEQSGDMDLAEFIESIPFDQTRHYVKIILGYFYQYRLLYAGPNHCPDLSTALRREFKNKIDF